MAEPNLDSGRFQFTLRSLLGLMTVLCVVMGMMAWSRKSQLGMACCILGALGFGVYCVVLGLRRRQFGEVLAGIFVVLMMLGLLIPPVGSGAHDHRSFVITTVVVDADDGKPIPGATVSITETGGSGGSSLAQTDSDGTAKITATLFAHSYTKYYTFRESRKEGTIYLDGEIEVESPGYKSVQMELWECVGTFGWGLYKPLPEVCIEMQPTPASQEEGM